MVRTSLRGILELQKRSARPKAFRRKAHFESIRYSRVSTADSRLKSKKSENNSDPTVQHSTQCSFLPPPYHSLANIKKINQRTQ